MPFGLGAGPKIPRLPDDSRSIAAVAAAWASRVIALGMQFVLPALAGMAFDNWRGLKNGGAGLVCGVLLGGMLGMWGLYSLVRQLASTREPK